MGEFATLLSDKANEALENLLKISEEQLVDELLENEVWMKCFAKNLESHLTLLNENIHMNLRMFL